MPKFMPFAGTMLKNLFSKPVTTAYPAKPAVYPERSRGHVEIAIDQCIMCGLCSRNCPPRAITVDRATGTWTINRFDCVQCGYCTEVCPKKCLTINPGYQTPGAEKKEAVYQKRWRKKQQHPREVSRFQIWSSVYFVHFAQRNVRRRQLLLCVRKRSGSFRRRNA